MLTNLHEVLGKFVQAILKASYLCRNSAICVPNLSVYPRDHEDHRALNSPNPRKYTTTHQRYFK